MDALAQVLEDCAVSLAGVAQEDFVGLRAARRLAFRELGLAIREEVVTTLFHAQIEVSDVDQLQQAQAAQGFDGGGVAYEHQSFAGADAIAAAGALEGNGGSVTAGALAAGGGGVATTQRVTQEREKIGRNDPCWCGSGKKFKRCHGA